MHLVAQIGQQCNQLFSHAIARDADAKGKLYIFKIQHSPFGLKLGFEVLEEKQAEPQAQYLSELERYWLET